MKLYASLLRKCSGFCLMAAGLACIVMLAPGVVKAASRETLKVPADGTTVQSQPLLAGQTYELEIYGTYVWGGCDAAHCPNGGPDYLRYGDAAFLTDDHWKTFSDPSWSAFIYLEINGQRFTPEAYDSGHWYSVMLQGEGKPISLAIKDCANCYADNSGSLTVEISRLSDSTPAPSQTPSATAAPTLPPFYCLGGKPGSCPGQSPDPSPGHPKPSEPTPHIYLTDKPEGKAPN